MGINIDFLFMSKISFEAHKQTHIQFHAGVKPKSSLMDIEEIKNVKTRSFVDN